MRESFLAHFRRRAHRQVMLINKRKSPLMRLINWCLKVGNMLGLCSIQDFLGGYTTTISNRIYSDPAWDEDRAPDPHTVHELTHVLLWSFLYALRFTFSAKWRLRYEADCIQAAMLCFPRLRSEAYCVSAASHLVPYGIRLEEAKRELALRLLQACSASRDIPHAPRQVWHIFSEWEHHV